MRENWITTYQFIERQRAAEEEEARLLEQLEKERVAAEEAEAERKRQAELARKAGNFYSYFYWNSR